MVNKPINCLTISALALSFEEYKVRQLNTGQRIAVNRSGINADFIGLHQRFL